MQVLVVVVMGVCCVFLSFPTFKALTGYKLEAVVPHLRSGVPGRIHENKEREITGREREGRAFIILNKICPKWLIHDSLTLMSLCEKHCMHFMRTYYKENRGATCGCHIVLVRGKWHIKYAPMGQKREKNLFSHVRLVIHDTKDFKNSI